MGDGVVVVDMSGKFLVFNPAARHILGSDAFSGAPSEWSQHYGMFLPDMVTLYPTGQLPPLRAIRGESVDEAEIYVRPAGSTAGAWLSFTARPLREDDDNVRGAVVVFRDITASKRAAEALKAAKQEAEEANHAKSEFLSRMSHELRTPLNSILGFAQILELGSLTEQQSDNVTHILKGGYHLLNLINEILDLARIESGRLSLSAEPVCVREAIQDAVDLVRPLAIQQNVTLSADAAIQCEHHVRADCQRLKQVLLNLLSNAIKYNRNGGSVIVSCSEIPDKKLRIEVVDTGIGIPPEGLKKIFKPFERLTADGSDITGTGLGLALSKRLVEAMGGTLVVESAIGLGSRFSAEFALIEDPSKWLETEDAAAVLIGDRPRAHRGTVLYIEDNSANLSLVEQILTHSPDIRLLSAMQGQLGLDLAELHTPDWILLDVHLPDIPGDEVLRRLRLNPRTRQIPVTILSADATDGQIARLMSAGARDYLTKPLDVRKLLSLLEATIPNGSLVGANVSNAYAERDHSK
jgi:signal transduction histidine kinase/ActR/RegA family two-component response regulator